LGILCLAQINVQDGAIAPGTTLQALKDGATGGPNIEVGTEDLTAPPPGSGTADSHSPMAAMASLALATFVFGLVLLQ